MCQNRSITFVRHDVPTLVGNYQNQKPLVPLLGFVSLSTRHPFARIWVHQLVLHAVDIQSVDARDNCVDLLLIENDVSITQNRVTVARTLTGAQIRQIPRDQFSGNKKHSRSVSTYFTESITKIWQIPVFPVSPYVVQACEIRPDQPFQKA